MTAVAWSDVVMDTYGSPPTHLVRGVGARVWDAEGREYLDMVAGIAVNALGHAHPAVIEAVSVQLSTLGHTSNLAATTPSIELASRLLALLDPEGRRRGRVFFANSGAEANEAAIKIARMTGRGGIVAAEGGFHGRTTGALAITGQNPKREPFQPLLPDVTFVPYGDASALTTAGRPSALILEAIQGEAGVVVPPGGYLSAASAWAAAVGALFVVDEVQTGIGRTGRWFAHQAESVAPDVVTLAKGLGGGLPIGACIAFGDASRHLGPGSHGSTFGGNPVCAAAALAVLTVIEHDNLLAGARVLGDRLTAGLEVLPGVSCVRGRGLMLGVVLDDPIAIRVEKACRENGLMVNAPVSNVLRLVPPLTLTSAEADEAVSRLAAGLSSVLSGPPGREGQS